MKEMILPVQCFNLKYTLECGQCFRWKKQEEENTYMGVIKDRVIKIWQIENELHIQSNKTDKLEEVITNYFDLHTNYQAIERKIVKIDSHVKQAINNTSGIRILHQDLFETIISYIISSNNNIPRISRAIHEISKRYGTKVEFAKQEFYLFPTIEQLQNVTQEEFRMCGVGFRDRYIVKTIKELFENKLCEMNINEISTDDLREKLLTLQGIGAKVADCILLFACDRKEVFPIDVWVERVMQVLYFNETHGTMKKKEILAYAKEKFGNYAGIVQQHLFHNIREKMI